jgi:hypothetical protein
MELEGMKHIALAAALLVDGCGANAFDEIEKDKARIEEEHQEHLKQLLAEQKTWEEDALECRRRARDLPIGVSEDQLPCCRNDAHGDYIAYAHVNLTTTRAGSTSQ